MPAIGRTYLTKCVGGDFGQLAAAYTLLVMYKLFQPRKAKLIRLYLIAGWHKHCLYTLDMVVIIIVYFAINISRYKIIQKHRGRLRELRLRHVMTIGYFHFSFTNMTFLNFGSHLLSQKIIGWLVDRRWLVIYIIYCMRGKVNAYSKFAYSRCYYKLSQFNSCNCL